MNEAVKWLESPEGEAWSRSNHFPIPAILAMIKDDTREQIDFLWYCSYQTGEETWVEESPQYDYA